MAVPPYLSLYQFQKSLSGKTARFKQRSVLLYMSSTDIAEGSINQSLVKMVLAPLYLSLVPLCLSKGWFVKTTQFS